MESKKPSTIPNNLRDSIFKLSDADIIAGDLTTMLSDMLVRFESDSILDVDKFVSQIKTVLKATEAVQKNIQEGIKLSGQASFSASYKSEKLASDKNSNKREDLLTYKKQRKNNKPLALHRLENVASVPNKRTFPDATKKWKVPNKGTVGDVKEGKKCKKMGQTLLLKWAYDKHLSPVTAKIPDRVQIVLPKMNLPPPSIVRFVSNKGLIDFYATVEWCGKAYLAIESIKNLGVNYLDCHLGGLVGLNNTCRLMARKLLDWLPSYIAERLPSERRDLQPGQHWVFSSLCKQLPRICTLMGLQSQIARDLETRGPDEGYLALPCEFQSVIGVIGTMNGAYVFEDSSRGNIIRAGTASAGLMKRFEQHVKASLLKDPKTNKMDVYRRYPHESIANEVPRCKGTFQSLKQLVGVAVDLAKKEDFAALFEWDDIELSALQKLTIKGESNSMVDKKCKHLIYLYEIALGIAIEPCMNVSGNPGCEWQLGYFGDN